MQDDAIKYLPNKRLKCNKVQIDVKMFTGFFFLFPNFRRSFRPGPLRAVRRRAVLRGPGRVGARHGRRPPRGRSLPRTRLRPGLHPEQQQKVRHGGRRRRRRQGGHRRTVVQERVQGQIPGVVQHHR